MSELILSLSILLLCSIVAAFYWRERYAAQDEAMATLVSAVQERNETIAKLCKKIDWLESEWFEAEAVEGEQ